MYIKPEHPYFTSASEISDLAAMLRPHNINYFNYGKKHVNGERLYLGTHPHVLANYLNQKLYLSGNTEANPHLYEKQFVLWSTLPNQAIYQFTREHDIDHGIYLIYPQKEYTEFFGFAASHQHPQIINFYLNNLDFLIKFTLYFRERAQKLLKEMEQYKLVLPYHDKPTEQYKLTPGVNSLLVKKCKLSSRQRECVSHLLRGATSKEIARELNLSFRTIETYIDALKIKFHARNKSDLILKLLETDALCIPDQERTKNATIASIAG